MRVLHNIHASCVALGKKGILLLGDSGAGKSDLSLRLIQNKKARLVADDRVELEAKEGKIFASSPENIKGLLEVRGVGICSFTPIDCCEVFLAVQLCDSIKDIVRIPEDEFFEFQGVKIKKIKLYPFEASSIDKLELACK